MTRNEMEEIARGNIERHCSTDTTRPLTSGFRAAFTMTTNGDKIAMASGVALVCKTQPSNVITMAHVEPSNRRNAPSHDE